LSAAAVNGVQIRDRLNSIVVSIFMFLLLVTAAMDIVVAGLIAAHSMN
jgi:hypothetical protein